jgi:hypothetical protein
VIELKRFDQEVHSVLAHASRLADQHKSDCISDVHLVLAATLVNKQVAGRGMRLGISQDNLLQLIGRGTRRSGATIPFCTAVERALHSTSGGLANVLGALADEDPDLLTALQECSSIRPSIEDVRRFLSRDIERIDGPRTTVVWSCGDVSGHLRPIEPSDS